MHGPQWSQRLSQLQADGLLTGFALLTGSGACKPATGPFTTLQDAGGRRDAEVERLVAPFYSPGPRPTSYDFRGEKLVVIHDSPGGFWAVSRHRALGLAARHLPCGVLLASFAWPTPAQQVACELDAACAALQA